jgi:hypothetical protein
MQLLYHDVSICILLSRYSLLSSMSCFFYLVVWGWSQTMISHWSEIKSYMKLAIQDRTCSIPKCVLQLLKVVWNRVITWYPWYYLVYETRLIQFALPCNSALTSSMCCKVLKWSSKFRKEVLNTQFVLRSEFCASCFGMPWSRIDTSHM